MRARRLVGISLLMCVAYPASEALAAALDPTFGTGGVVMSDFGAPSSVSAIALQADGKIVAAGVRGTEFLVTRYLPSGTVDGGFAGGYATTSVDLPGYPWSPYSIVGGVVIRPDGRIVVAGAAWILSGMLGEFYPVALGFTTHGARDSSWGNGGTALPGGNGTYTYLALQPDGKLLAAGSHYKHTDSYRGLSFHFAVARYNDNGTLDAGFAGGSGQIESTPNDQTFALQPDGTILTARWNDNTFFTQRYSPSGSPTSASSSQVGISNEAHLGIALQPDGKILMAGRAGYPGLGLLARFNASGTHDTGFANGGVFASNPPISRLALQPDGKIVGLNSRFELTRLNSDGTPDTSFGRQGRFAVAVPPDSVSNSLVLQPDGKIVVAGHAAGPYNVNVWPVGSVTGGRVVLARVDPSVPSPAVAVAPTSLDFGGQSVGTTSAPQVVTFTNNGASPITVSDVVVPLQYTVVHDCAAVAAGASCGLQVRFAPQSGSTPGSPLTIVVAGEAIYVPLSGAVESTLTSHYYRSILRREPDAGGRTFWNGEAARVASLGADPVETWFAMAMSFFGSSEYAAFNRDNTAFVTDLYNTFYNRPPDTGGRDYWVGQLQSGLPREVALAAFMFSTEFGGFIRTYYGSPTIRAEIGMVFDFYRGLLGRLPDSSGLAYWVGRFRQAQCQNSVDNVRFLADQISGEFARSAEYAARGRNNSQYVGDLYNAFLRRGGDLGGVQFWIGQLDSGAQTREGMRGQFVTSPEFSARVTAVANQGCLQ